MADGTKYCPWGRCPPASSRASRAAPALGAASRSSTGWYSRGAVTSAHVRRNTMSRSSTLSSNVALHAPSLPGTLAPFLTVPRMPETVRTEAPSNLATSSWELNMPSRKAVFFMILKGVPTSLSFFTTRTEWSSCRTVPVAATLQPAARASSLWKARSPVLGGVKGPVKVARQCMCSGEYLSMRKRPLTSSMAYSGMDWNRLHPMLNTRGSMFLRILRCHRWRLSRTCITPTVPSPALRPPSTRGREGRKFCTSSHGAPHSRMRTYVPGRKPSISWRRRAPSASSSRRVLRSRSSMPAFTLS
mmetsp:Transcript_11596/g.32574  ORF Transcript_11596/g.32574 Transcript_11596/m.32574 type:complete len:302 (-) Transcript_11596:47-952(-)